MKELYKKYIREYTFPEIFCPGCGYGIFLNAFIRALDELGIKKGDIGIVSGGGCGAWMGMNLDVDVFKCLHGRSIAFAEGVKIARPDKPVVAFTGDGENVGIGGNHMIHAARRNIDITCFQLTNLVYGMTGAQKAPTTPLYGKTKTSPYGNEEEPFDVGRLCIAAGDLLCALDHRASGPAAEGHLRGDTAQGLFRCRGHQPVPHGRGQEHVRHGPGLRDHGHVQKDLHPAQTRRGAGHHEHIRQAGQVL